MKPGFVRIIGGKWRTRRLQIADVDGLRPTPDRVRETLFNWLVPYINGAHCLDLFAGTGVLGMEALSRGAASIILVDQSPVIVKKIQADLTLLQAENALVYQAILPQGLKPNAQPFDIVFLDPPYASNLLLPLCFYLEKQGFLSSSAKIYLEARDIIKDNELPANWHIIKQQKAGQVHYYLAQRNV